MVRKLPNYSEERYDSINSIIEGIETSTKLGRRIEDNLILSDTIRRVLVRHSMMDVEIKQDNVETILQKLRGLSDEETSKEDEILRQTTDKRDELEEGKLDSARVPTELIRDLINEYETYLANGLDENQALNTLHERHRESISRNNIENVVKRQREIYNETIKEKEKIIEKQKSFREKVILTVTDIKNRNKREEIKDDEAKQVKPSKETDEICKIISTEQLILERKITEKAKGVDSKKVAKEVMKEVLMPSTDRKKGQNNNDRFVGIVSRYLGKVPDIEKKQILEQVIEERVAVTTTQVQLFQKTEAVTDKLINNFKQDERLSEYTEKHKDEIRQTVRKMGDRLVEDSNLNFTSEVELMSLEIQKAFEGDSGITLPDELKTSIETNVKQAGIELNAWAETKVGDIVKLQKEKVSDSIVSAVVVLNPNLAEDKLNSVREYSKLVGEIYFYSPDIIKHKQEAVDLVKLRGYSDGQINYAWKDLRGLASILKMSPDSFNGFLKKYKQLAENLGDIKLPTKLTELNVVEGFMRLASEMPEINNLINLTQKYVRTYNLINKFSGGLLSRLGFEKMGASIMNSVGGQAMAEFTKQSLLVFAEQGVKNGSVSILKGILSGGVKAAAGATQAGAGAAGATGVAGAVAAFQAIPVAGQIVLAGALLYAAYKKIVKPIISVFKGMLKGMGVDMDKMKYALQETFGKFFGGMINFGINATMIVIGIPALIATVSFTTFIAPVIIFIMIGLMGYSMTNSNLVSSLVPPIKIGQQTGGYIEDTGGPVDLSNLPEDCPSMWPTNSGCVTQGPLTLGTHAGTQAIDIGCVGYESPIYTTHAGLAVPFHTAGCGYGVDVYSTCNGVKFRTHFCHGPYPVLTKQTQVKKGDKILVVDNTGLSFGNHIHYDLKILGPINNYLPRKVPQGCIGLVSCGNMLIKSFNQ
jgi:hypothetical protein